MDSYLHLDVGDTSPIVELLKKYTGGGGGGPLLPILEIREECLPMNSIQKKAYL